MRLETILSAVILLAACGKKDTAPDTQAATAASTAPTSATTVADATSASAPETTTPAPDVAPEPPKSEACLAFPNVEVDHVTLAAGKLTFCGEAAGTGWCYTSELADTTSAAKGEKLAADDIAHIANSPGPLEDPFRKKDEAPVVQLCLDAHTGCRDAFVGDVLAARMSADGKAFALVTLGDREKVVRLFDAATVTETKSYAIEKDVDLPDCSFAVPVAGVLLVSTGSCSETIGRKAWLMDPETGAKIADVGGVPDAAVRLGDIVALDGDKYAFRDAAKKKLFIQDVKRGEVLATAELDAGRSLAWLFVADGKIVVVQNLPTPGAAVIVDPATGKIDRRVTPDACAK